MSDYEQYPVENDFWQTMMLIVFAVVLFVAVGLISPIKNPNQTPPYEGERFRTTRMLEGPTVATPTKEYLAHLAKICGEPMLPFNGRMCWSRLAEATVWSERHSGMLYGIYGRPTIEDPMGLKIAADQNAHELRHIETWFAQGAWLFFSRLERPRMRPFFLLDIHRKIRSLVGFEITPNSLNMKTALR